MLAKRCNPASEITPDSMSRSPSFGEQLSTSTLSSSVRKSLCLRTDGICAVCGLGADGSVGADGSIGADGCIGADGIGADGLRLGLVSSDSLDGEGDESVQVALVLRDGHIGADSGVGADGNVGADGIGLDGSIGADGVMGSDGVPDD